MSGKKPGYVSLDEIVKATLDRCELSMSKYIKFWGIGYSFVVELGLDFFNQVKTSKVPVMANKTARLPEDCLSWTKIGLLNAKGEVVPMEFNSKITNFASTRENRAAKTEDRNLFGYYNYRAGIFYNYWYNDAFNHLYGVPSGGKIGSFNIDEQNGIITLGEWFIYEYLMIEYQVSPDISQEVYVPIEFREAIITGIMWRHSAGVAMNKRGAIGVVALNERTYYNERRLANARYAPFDLMQAYEWNLQNQRMTVKV